MQVAVSFLTEIARLLEDEGAQRRWPWLADVRIEASPAVVEGIRANEAQLPVVVARRRPKHVWRWLPRRKKFAVSFVVFGPDYSAPRALRTIEGYADVTSVYPRPGPLGPERLVTRAKRELRGWVSRALLRRADRVVVETEAFGRAVTQRVRTLSDRIVVIPNCVNSELLAMCPIPIRPHDGPPRLLYIARGYPHKNHDFLGLVGAELQRRGTPVEFAVTLNDDQWEQRSTLLHRHAVNLGQIAIADLPSAYAGADAVVFPSLLEAFSAAPLEALAAGRTLFASDRDFVRTICGDRPIYADPEDPKAWADRIQEWLVRGAPAGVGVGGLSTTLPTAAGRATAYLELIATELTDRPNAVGTR